jgi:choice-of-anchor A domain-containing protein
MRLLSGVAFVNGLTFLMMPAATFADDARSWCTPGSARIRGASSDANTNLVVEYVCSQQNYGTCCTDGWTLECIQKGALWARPAMGDVCGRFAWTQKVIPGTGQRSPADFSLVVLGGGASGFRDMRGPVAAAGNVTAATGFSLNGYSHQPVAMISTGKVTLTSGTVYGHVQWGPQSTSQWVTWVQGSASQIANPPPISFAELSGSLQGMSDIIAKYNPSEGASTARPPGSPVVTFTGGNAELNVFSLTTDQINGATQFTFNVPASSAVIVNVVGQGTTVGKNAYFRWAGFNGSHGVPAPSGVLWNFSDAEVLQLAGMSFPGSILAPRAQADFLWGQVLGTVVVRDTLDVTSEFHWFPYQGLTCKRGCLCWDENWSCSKDTYRGTSGFVVFPAPEAGFIQIPGGTYRAQGNQRTSPTHRIWYAFRPASSSPQDKPLAVFFNGGPGYATSAGLFSFGTNHWTLDPAFVGSSEYAQNPDSWAQFANLLYIDAPATGFSYSSDAGTPGDVGNDIDRDAGTFLRVIVRFLARHPAIQRNPVILVGESYGGVRATLMLTHLFGYADLDNPDPAYQDAQLLSDLQSYFSAVLSTSTPGPVAIATKFGFQILIQPAIVGGLQQEVGRNLNPVFQGTSAADNPVGCDPNCIANGTCDGLNCDKEFNWGLAQGILATTNLTHLSTLRTVLGVEPTTIQWMYRDERTSAYGRGGCSPYNCPPDGDLVGQFGALNADDSYFVARNNHVEVGYGYGTSAPAIAWDDMSMSLPLGSAFLQNLLRGVDTFITVAKFDGDVYTPAIAPILDAAFAVDALYDPLAANVIGNGRNGRMVVFWQPQDLREVAMPYYATGHSVSQRDAHQLFQDAMRWYGKVR